MKENLRPKWMSHDGVDYQVLGDRPATGLNTIYFQLESGATGNILLLESGRPYFVFVNGKVGGEYTGRTLLNIDSLFGKAGASSCWVSIHQEKINARDMRTEIVSMEPARADDDGNAVKPYSYLRDFVVIAGLLIILWFLLLIRLHPKLAADYFSIARIISSREAEDGQASARMTGSSNIQFYLFCSLMIGFYLLIVIYNLPSQYALPNHFGSTDFWMIWVQWLKISMLVLLVLVMKILIIFSVTRLFGFSGVARFHFFNWIRLLLVFLGAGTILLFTYFISRGDSPGYFVFFLSLVVAALLVWTVVAFFKLSGRTGHSMFHLFSYLCATEIIPLLITVKVLFQ